MAAGRGHPAARHPVLSPLQPRENTGARGAVVPPRPPASPEHPWVRTCRLAGSPELVLFPCVPAALPCGIASHRLEIPKGCSQPPCPRHGAGGCKIGSVSKTFGGGEQAGLVRAPAMALPCHPPPALSPLPRECSGPARSLPPQTHPSAGALHSWAGAGVRNEK